MSVIAALRRLRQENTEILKLAWVHTEFKASLKYIVRDAVSKHKKQNKNFILNKMENDVEQSG